MVNSLSLSAFTPDQLQIFARIKYGKTASKEELNDLNRYLGQPNILLERDCFFVLDESAPVGYMILIKEEELSRCILEYGVIDSPKKIEITHFLLRESIRLTQSSNLKVTHIDVPDSGYFLNDLHISPFWQHARTHLHLTSLFLQPISVELNKNLNIRIAARSDVASITSLQNRAFYGSWGYCPNVEMEIEYRIFDLPREVPDTVLILEQNNLDVGYCWTHVDPDKNIGHIGMVGVLPGHQGKGFGKLLTSIGVNYLRDFSLDSIEITVDSQNFPAIHVYESVGFKLSWRSFWYQHVSGS